MRRFSIILIFFSAVISSISADLMLYPAMGIQHTHPMVPNDARYKYLINNQTGNLDDLAVALAGTRKYAQGTTLGNDTLKVTVDCDSMVFRSDENPVYERPFKLFFLVRGVLKDTEEDDWAENVDRGEVRATIEIENGKEYNFPQVINDGRSYRWFWTDIVLQLDNDGEEIAGGVVVDNTFYPLIQGTYSAQLTVTATFTDPNGNQKENSIPIVIPGYYSLSSSSMNDAACAMTITPYAHASNLSLDALVEGLQTSESVGKIDFLFRGKNSGNSNPDDDSVDFSIFLSASPDPFTPDYDGFKLVHEDFVAGESAYSDTNSIDYVVDVRGDSRHPGLNQTFDGTDYLDPNSGATKNIPTECNKEWTDIGQGYIHFHTYGGELSIRLENSGTGSERPNLLASGRYSSTIYVHVVDGGHV